MVAPMSNPQSIPPCLKSENLDTIKEYLSICERALIAEAERKNAFTQDRFLELTQAIECVQKLRSIDKTIADYWFELERW